MKQNPLLESFSLGKDVTLRNRIVMAPMTTWASNDDGTVSDEEETYYRLRVKDVGLVITGCTHVQKNGIGFTGEFATYDDKFIPSLKRLAAAAKSGGAPAILQIFHAGVKTSPQLVSDIVAASAVPSDAGPFTPSITPRALTGDEIDEIIAAFGEATRRAIEAGFDGVELHGAHGFLLQNFFSPHSNQRDDQWGGSIKNRMNFPLGVVKTVRKIITEHATSSFLLGYRISLEEHYSNGLRINESLQLVNHLINEGIDYLHVSLNNALEDKSIDAPNGPQIIETVEKYLAGRIPLIVAGHMRTPEQAANALKAGASLMAIGQGLIMNPDWVKFIDSKDQRVITLSINDDDVTRLAIPKKLWREIEKTVGWFNIR